MRRGAPLSAPARMYEIGWLIPATTRKMPMTKAALRAARLTFSGTLSLLAWKTMAMSALSTNCAAMVPRQMRTAGLMLTVPSCRALGVRETEVAVLIGRSPG